MDRAIIRYALEAYSFVLPPGEYTGEDFAAAIGRVYDPSEPRNAAVIATVRRGVVSLTKTHLDVTATLAEGF